jgi:dihydropyrimidine dehydrogenase (NAD+) subunit PreA
MGSLGIEFLGFSLDHPFLLASGPPTRNGEMIEEAFREGWAGAVTKTLTLEKVSVKNLPLRFYGFRLSSGGIYGLENIEKLSSRPLNVWERELERLAGVYPQKFLIASIMAEADCRSDWQELALRCERARVKAIELNFSCPHGGMPGEKVGHIISQDPSLCFEITSWVKEVVKIPVIVKVSPSAYDVVQVVNAVKKGGADAISAINTLSVIAGVDISSGLPLPSVFGKSSRGGLSGPALKPLALRIIADLAPLGLPISGIGGISNFKDAIEFMLLGASTVQMCTQVMLKGYKIIHQLKEGLLRYLKAQNLRSISNIIGKGLSALVDLEEIRAAPLRASINHDLCTKCNSCYISCRYGGNKAIFLEAESLPVIDRQRCDGCGLCKEVCPNDGCIQLLPD